MTSQEGRAGGSFGCSPPGPDSTCVEGELMSGHKLEARLQAMEAKLLKEQEEAFNRIIEEVRMGRQQVTEEAQPLTDTPEIKTLLESMESMTSKLDLLLGGEN